jgi:hypothetical protein
MVYASTPISASTAAVAAAGAISKIIARLNAEHGHQGDNVGWR